MRADDAIASDVQRYIEGVRSGDVVAGRLVRLAIDRHARDLKRAKKEGRIRFNEQRARRVAWWIENRCRFSKGRWASAPFILAPWQAFVVFMVFGWERKNDAGWVRRFRTAYVSVARKNGKTELAAAIGLVFLMLAGETEAGAEVYSAATTKDQAALCWRAASSIVKKSPLLAKEIGVHESRYNMARYENEAKFEAVASDSDTLDGKSPLLNIIDEYHAHPDSKVRDVLDSGMGARAEPLTLIITTAGEKRSGACWEQEVDSVKALEAVGEEAGAYDDVFAFIARLDEKHGDQPEDDPFDESKWPKANPNLGVSTTLEYLQIEARAAKRKPSSKQEFLRKHCNLWTEASSAWIDLVEWDANGDAPPADPKDRTLPPAGNKRRCIVALDLSSIRDYTAGSAVMEPDDSNVQDIYMGFFIPAETAIDRIATDRAPVKSWMDDGWVYATPGNVVDQDAVKQWLINMRERAEVLEVAMDPYNATKLQTELTELSFKVVSVTQNPMSMSPLIKETEKTIRSKKFRHGGNPVLRWMVGNVAQTKDKHDNVQLNKAKSTDRIDGAVALCMARGRWDSQEKPKQYSGKVVWLS